MRAYRLFRRTTVWTLSASTDPTTLRSRIVDFSSQARRASKAHLYVVFLFHQEDLLVNVVQREKLLPTDRHPLSATAKKLGSDLYLLSLHFGSHTSSLRSHQRQVERVQLRQFKALTQSSDISAPSTLLVATACHSNDYVTTKMRGLSSLSAFLVSFSIASNVSAAEQQPFDFGEMSAPQYTLPPLPYAYDVCLNSNDGLSARHADPTGAGTPHLRPDHGATSQQTPPDLHYQPQRLAEDPSRSRTDFRHYFASWHSARHQVQRRWSHQPFSVLAGTTKRIYWIIPR